MSQNPLAGLLAIRFEKLPDVDSDFDALASVTLPPYAQH